MITTKITIVSGSETAVSVLEVITVNHYIDLPVDSTGGGHIIQDDGTSKTQRTKLNLIGFTVADDSVNDATKVTNTFTSVLKSAYDACVTWISTNGTNLLNHIGVIAGNPHGTTYSDVGAAAAGHNHSGVYQPVGNYELSANKNQSEGYAGLTGGKISITQIPDAVLGQVEYQGLWNAETNDPALPAASTVKGWYYIVSHEGTYSAIEFEVGDWCISDGVSWSKVDNTDAVTMVAGRKGAVVLTADDVAETNDKKYASTAEKSAWNDSIHKGAAAEISGLTDKATPVDADVVMIEDSATTPTAFGKKKITWANIKATLITYFDGLYTNKLIAFNPQSDSYTLVLADGTTETLVQMGKATAQNLTIPTIASVNYDVGTKIYVEATGAGQITFVAGSANVTIFSVGSRKKSAAQGCIFLLILTAKNTGAGTSTWSLYGDLIS